MEKVIRMEKQGSVLGGVLLVAGSCIGAGMLALPVITGVSGFIPSLVMFMIAWSFMTATSLLLLEANLSVGHELSLISIAERTLGKWGRLICWLLFLFLFYSLSIAYIAASGSILEGIIADLFDIKFSSWVGSLLFTVVFGCVLYTGVRHVDYLNRALMVGLIVFYCVLVILGSLYIRPAYLATAHWKYSIAALPVLVISFGFHNMIPSLAMYMHGDRKRLRISILIGSLIPLIIYVIWEAVMLGIIPIEGREGLLKALDKGEVVTTTLREVVGKSWINNVAQAFALLAIVTSFLAQSLSLIDFLSDGLKIAKVGFNRFILVLITLVPPFILAFIYPDIFIKALNMAGGFSAVILFGIIPVLMVWTLRYTRKEDVNPLLPLGRLALIVIAAIAVGIFLVEGAQELGFSLLPKGES
jgi:tyrosine-specific transport protein